MAEGEARLGAGGEEGAVVKTSRKEGPGEDEAEEEVEGWDLAKVRSLRRRSSMGAAPRGADAEAEVGERRRSRMSAKGERGGGSEEAGSDGGGGGTGEEVEEEEEEKWRGRKGSRRMRARRSAMAGAAEGNGRSPVGGGG